MRDLEPREEPTKKELEEIEKMLKKNEFYDEEFDDFDAWDGHSDYIDDNYDY